MRKILRVLPALPALALAACATAPQVTTVATDTTMMAPDVTTLQAPAQTTASAASMTDASAFVDPTAFSQLSANSKTQLASAQFNALQFGRVGAPRNWVGDNGASGQVTVGPFLRVNLIDCRDFSHTVTINGTSFVHSGTACREADGSWTVSA